MLNKMNKSHRCDQIGNGTKEGAIMDAFLCPGWVGGPGGFDNPLIWKKKHYIKWLSLEIKHRLT